MSGGGHVGWGWLVAVIVVVVACDGGQLSFQTRDSIYLSIYGQWYWGVVVVRTYIRSDSISFQTRS